MIFEVGDDIYGIDLFEEGRPYRSSAYLIRDTQLTLVETGSARSHEKLIEGLKELGVSPRDLCHVVVTHVHLDHSGGAGQLMALAPEATLHCHPRAARHLIDPSRLSEGARAVYGNGLDQIFGSLQPVPADRVVSHEEGTTLELARRQLIFLDTPGHAKHHTSVVDTGSRGLFSGDMVGIRYHPGYTGWPFVYGFPSTTPSDFDPDVMLKTLDRLQRWELSAVYHTHYGVTRPSADAFAFSRHGVEIIQSVMSGLSSDASLAEIQARLQAAIERDLKGKGRGTFSVTALALDLMLNSQGIRVYLQKRAAGKL